MLSMITIYGRVFYVGLGVKYSISAYPNTDNLLAVVLLAEIGRVPGHPGFESHRLLPIQVQVSSKILLRKATV